VLTVIPSSLTPIFTAEPQLRHTAGFYPES
jgi:hypothetical protein